ncbi:acyltransferase family protein [Myxococcota bacterium]|nr:acyltransferase family protein [Myxococcota bacterium]MCZ7620459.1 acyltransferase family protein [Myxococcota bacterium]
MSHDEQLPDPTPRYGDGPERDGGPGPAAGDAALGSDPFADRDGPDPLAPWLDALDRITAGEILAVAAESGATAKSRQPARADELAERREPRTAGAASPAAPAIQRRRRPRASQPTRTAPPRGQALRRGDESELPPELRLLARLVGDDPARRLAAVGAGIDGWDRFGLSPNALQQAFPIFYALYRSYFRVRSEGHQNLPATGPVVLAANHGGLLPFDGAMAVMDVLLHSEPPRLARAILDRFAGALPWVNVFMARVGQVVGTHENFSRLLDDGEAILVFPEGIDGIRKPITQRYRLQAFHVGFVEHALRAGAPVVPMAILGSDDQAPILFDVKPLARWLGLPAAPITPTFPWFGPVGLLPYPVRYRIVYGEPLCFHERFAASAADDPAVVSALAGQVRRAIQRLIDGKR